MNTNENFALLTRCLTPSLLRLSLEVRSFVSTFTSSQTSGTKHLSPSSLHQRNVNKHWFSSRISHTLVQSQLGAQSHSWLEDYRHRLTLLNVLSQVGCCVAVFIFNNKNLVATSRDQIRYASGKYSTGDCMQRKHGHAR
jgi:hypothetical protein